MTPGSSSSCSTCPQRSETVWCVLSPSELDLLNSFRRERVYGPGEPLYHQGDPCKGVFCIRDGLVGERRVDRDGTSALMRLNHSGTTLGYRELLTRTDFRNSAEALQESRVCFLDRAIVSRLLVGNPSLGERFLHRSLRDLQQTEDSYLIARKKSVRSRLLHLLLILYERHGIFDGARGHVLQIPITRYDLASMVGTGPETISRTIRQLQEDNIARFDGRMAFFPSIDALYREISDP